MSVKIVFPEDVKGKKKVQNLMEKYYAQVVYASIAALEVDLKRKQEILEEAKQLLLVSKKD